MNTMNTEQKEQKMSSFGTKYGEKDSSKTRSEKIVAKLHKGILNGEYCQGCTLSEQQIAEEADCSRTPVREAFSKLEVEGLIKNTQKGWVVRGFQKKDIIEIFQIRKFCERFIVKKAARMIDEENKAEIEMCLNLMKINLDKNDRVALKKWCSRFNQILIRASRAGFYLRNTLNRTYDIINYFAEKNFEDSDRRSQSVKEHDAIGQAVINGDWKEAQNLTKEHVEKVKTMVLDRLTSEENNSNGITIT